MSKLSLTEQIEKALYLKDGDKYDHRNDPRDVTGLMEADPALRRQLLSAGHVVRWAIDGRYRLTDSGFREMERRKALIAMERRKGNIRPFEEDWKDQKARDAVNPPESAEDRLKRSIRKHGNAANS